MISSSVADVLPSRPTLQFIISCARGCMNRVLSASSSSTSAPFPGCLRKDADGIFLGDFAFVSACFLWLSTLQIFATMDSTLVTFAISEDIPGTDKALDLYHDIATALPTLR